MNPRQKQLIYNHDNEITIEMVNSQYVNSNRCEFEKDSEFAITKMKGEFTIEKRNCENKFNVKTKIVNLLLICVQ